MSARILVWDIENTPASGYFYGATYNTNIIKVIEPSRVMCFAAKWRGDPKVEYRSTFHDGETVMLDRARDLLDEADAVISYNGRKHDSPHITTEFLRVQRGFPSPYREIDLYAVTKRKAQFQKNSLDYVSQELEIGKKIEHEGIELWLKCMAGDPKAWARFKRYNIQDVRLTDAYYERLLPLIPQSMHPNLNLYTDGDVCPKCGSTDIGSRGTAPTTVSLFPRFKCNACGTWSQSKRAVKRADIRGVTG